MFKLQMDGGILEKYQVTIFCIVILCLYHCLVFWIDASNMLGTYPLLGKPNELPVQLTPWWLSSQLADRACVEQLIGVFFDLPSPGTLFPFHRWNMSCFKHLLPLPTHNCVYTGILSHWTNISFAKYLDAVYDNW